MKKSFNEFCSEIDKLEEHESGKLKGGFSSLVDVEDSDKELSTNNGTACYCRVTKSSDSFSTAQ